LGVAEELQRIMKDGHIPESEVESAGLDPQSVEHLMKMVEDIKDQLLAPDGLPLALSRIDGTRRLFGATLLKDVRTVSNVDLLMRIYLLP